MRRKRLLVVAGIVLAVAVAVVALRPFIERRSLPGKYARIRDGMTEAEVTALLGMPPRNSYSLTENSDLMEPTPTDEVVYPGSMKGRFRRENPAVRCKGWGGDHWTVNVWFDESGAAVDKDGFVYAERSAPKLLRRLAALLGW